jgi:hypothetical protein
MAGDQMEKEFYWAAEGRRRHDEGHRSTLLLAPVKV